MLTGTLPFLDQAWASFKDIYRNILNKKVYVPRKLSKEAKDLLGKLLIRDPEKRLGAEGVGEILNHPFFKNINWKKVYNKEYIPPYIPKLKGEIDLKNIHDDYLKQDLAQESLDPEMTNEEKTERHLPGFSFTKEELLRQRQF